MSQPDPFRIGVPERSQLEWFGDEFAPGLFDGAVRRMESLGSSLVEVDFAPFAEAARLLYGGPWIAERWVALRDFFSGHAEKVFPVTRRIIEQGAHPTAADAFAAQDRLQELRRAVEPTWERIDALLLPTAAFCPTLDQVEADPVGLNARLGTYTNFTNLLDLAALAVPAGFRPDGMPFGVSLMGPAWSDSRLAQIGSAFHKGVRLQLLTSAAEVKSSKPDPFVPAVLPTPAEVRSSKPDRFVPAVLPTPAEVKCSQPDPFVPAVLPTPAEVKCLQPDPLPASYLPLAVVGAHLSGQPLNHQLTGCGGRFVRADRTAPCYRLYRLPGSGTAKPGLVRGPAGTGGSIELEVWELPEAAWARFVAGIPAPLGIGTLALADGSTVKGFLCESEAVAGAEEITRHGGWLAYLRRRV